MDFLKLAEERYSCRKFIDKDVEPEKIDNIIKAGLLAPTAKNLQPGRFYRIESKEGLEKIRAITPATFNAHSVLLLCTDAGSAWVNPFDDFNSADLDMGIIVAHMMLAAADMGLGTTCVAWFDTAKVKQEFNIPDNLQPRLLLPVGYPAPDVKVSPLHEQSKPAEEYVTVL